MRKASVSGLMVLMLSASLAAQSPKPKRINKAIELLEQGQPVYYGYHGGGRGDGFEQGKKAAQTGSDYIAYDLEHQAFDMTKLREFMLGLVEGGPTKSGHRTPAVIVTLPIHGDDEASMRTNAWMIQQVLASGVHGLNMIFSSSPGAVREFVRAARYSFAPPAAGIAEGTRGSGSQGFAAEIWGVSRNEYTLKADPWPLNPEGELLLGVKIETHHAVPYIEELTRVSGIGLAEWASTDMGYSLLGAAALQPASERTQPQLTRMNAARSRLLAATKAANIAFLQTCGENNILDLLKEGVMICGGGGDGPGSMKGREFTKRPRPW